MKGRVVVTELVEVTTGREEVHTGITVRSHPVPNFKEVYMKNMIKEVCMKNCMKNKRNGNNEVSITRSLFPSPQSQILRRFI